MDKIEVGEWVRFKDGIVDRIKDIIKIQGDRKLIAFEKSNSYKSDIGLKNVKKHSKNKIDLLEDSDFVELEYKTPKYRERITRVFEVSKLETGYITFENRHCEFFIDEKDKKITDKICKNIKIKSILTHEQFESRKYYFGEK